MTRLRQILKPYLEPFYWRWVRCCVRWPRLANLHYAISSQFQREHLGVLAGRLAHHQSHSAAPDSGQGSDEASRFRFRRLIHRLEKGLVMIPRRSTFAVDFIPEVIELYEKLFVTGADLETRVQRGSGPVRQIDATLEEWGEDVLDQYFSVAGGHSHIENARIRFEQVRRDRREDALCAPYLVERAECSVDYHSMLAMALRRRSVRWYQDRVVPRDLIDKAIQVASLSPSACNRQPFRFHVFDQPKHARVAAKLPGGSSGFQQNIPCLIVAVGDLRAYAKEYDRHVIYVDSGLALMGLIYAFESLGLATCCLNWADIAAKEKAMSDMLSLQPYERTVMCLSVGFPLESGQVPFSQKKSLDEIRLYRTTQ